MELRQLGSLQVSAVGLGCNNFGGRLDPAGTASVIGAALDAGITFFDTADIYGNTASESLLGEHLRSVRDEVVIGTKFGMAVDDDRRGAKPEYVKRALEDSLRRLRTDRIDLYQLHEPDPETPLEATLEALDECVKAGKVREIGCSNFTAEQLRKADAAARPGAARFVSVQNYLNILHRDPDATALAECQRLGLSYLPFYPLERGLLTGKFRSQSPVPTGTRVAGLSEDLRRDLLSEDTLATVGRLTEWSEDRGHDILSLAIGWLLSHPAVPSVIAGAMTPEQVRSNVAAAGWTLTPEDLTQLEEVLAR
jgi:aryl-alcohol dehydrogenase-like predicted oxidoreductase